MRLRYHASPTERYESPAQVTAVDSELPFGSVSSEDADASIGERVASPTPAAVVGEDLPCPARPASWTRSRNRRNAPAPSIARVSRSRSARSRWRCANASMSSHPVPRSGALEPDPPVGFGVDVDRGIRPDHDRVGEVAAVRVTAQEVDVDRARLAEISLQERAELVEIDRDSSRCRRFASQHRQQILCKHPVTRTAPPGEPVDHRECHRLRLARVGCAAPSPLRGRAAVTRHRSPSP